jgi:hypothetical protein
LFVFVLGWTSFAAATILSLFLLITAIPFVIGKPKYEVQFNIEYDRVVAGNDVTGSIVVKNVGSGLSFGSRLEIPMVCTADASLNTTVVLWISPLRSGHEQEVEFILPTKCRAVFDVGPAVGIKTDSFRLFRIEHTYSKLSKLFVHPQTLPLPSSEIGMIRDVDGDATDRVTVSDISFHDIRDYAPGDPIGNINWKASAKLDKLQVRTFEESYRAKIVFALSTNSADYANDEEFELAISALASLGFRSAVDNRDIEVVTSQTPSSYIAKPKLDITISSNKTAKGVLDSFSAVGKSHKDMNLLELCQKITDKINDVSLCVLGVGSMLGLKELQAAAFRLPKNAQLIVICANEYKEPQARKIGNITYISISVLNDLKQVVARQVI